MAQTAAQKTAAKAKAAAAKQAAKDKLAMDKAMAARGAARKEAAAKEKTYIQSLENPITSQYDPRIRLNAGYDPVKEGVMTSGGQTQEQAKTEKEIDKDTRDAFALLEEAFKLYGLESLVPVIRKYMLDDLGVEQAKLKLKTEKVYQDRFKGNELRVASGRNVLSEAEYLELENDYSETLRSYGLADYFGVATDAASRLARQQKMAQVIGGDISATEFKDRIKTVVTRVNMADKETKDALKSLYNITDTDLVKYFLNPAEGSEQLKEKVTVAEISAASVVAGLGQTSLGTAQELARLGIDKARALKGYEEIAAYLPTTEKLSAIYKAEGITYNKATGEEEEFKGLASAKRKRQRLVERETSTFAGSSGTSQVSLKTKTAGQI